MLKIPNIKVNQRLGGLMGILRKFLFLKQGRLIAADTLSAVLVFSAHHQCLKKRFGNVFVVNSDCCLTKSEGICRMLNSAKNLVASKLSILKILLHNIPYVKVAGWRRLEALSAPLWLSRKGLQSDMAGKKEQSGMTENVKNNGLVNVVICNGGVIC